MEKVDLNKYKDFVEKVTSIQSNDTGALAVQLEKLENDSGVNMALLLTGAIGIASEGGEYAEIVKNVSFKVSQWTMKLNFILNENLAILLGIGLIVAGHWVSILMKS